MQANQSKSWTVPELNGVRLLSATYRTQTFARHTHDHFVIGVNESGTEGFLHKGSLRIAPSGTIVIINPGDVHTGYSAGADAWVYRGMYPEPRLLQEATSQIVGRAQPVPSFTHPVIRDRDLTRQLMRLHRTLEGPHGILEAHSLLLGFLAQLISRYGSVTVQPEPLRKETERVRRIRDYIHSSHKESISLKDIAEVAGLSPYYTIRVFRKEVGLPPYEFLTQVRVERAKRLLQDGWPISSIASEVGFFDQSHFTRHFNRFTGVTPKRYVQGQDRTIHKSPRAI